MQLPQTPLLSAPQTQTPTLAALFPNTYQPLHIPQRETTDKVTVGT
jgi:hypothetical protein